VRKGIHQLQFEGSFHDELPTLGLPEIAFAGRSNVGKSSCLNTLLQRKRAARTSSTPGRTQAINLFRLGDLGVFADLPGYGYAKVPQHVKDRWKATIESYLTTRDDLRMVVLLVDARRDPQALDGQLLWALVESGVPSLVVATKVDKLKKSQRGKQLAALRREFSLPAGQPLPFSSVTGEGRDALWSRIEAAAAAPPPSRPAEPEPPTPGFGGPLLPPIDG
jgi:GTP-binding protein